MLDNKRKIKRIATMIILVAFLAIGLSGLRIRSVAQYRQEQKQLAKEILVDEPSGRDESTDETLQSEENNLQEDNAAEGDREQSGSDDRQGEKTTTGGSGQKNNSAGRTDASGNNSSGSANKSSGGKRGSGSRKTSSDKNKSSGDTSGLDSGAKTTKKPSVSATTKPLIPATPTPSQSDGSFICSITIRCDSLLKHWDDLSDTVKKKVPGNGFLLEKTSVEMTASDTAFSILEKTCKAKNIALDAEYSILFSSEYVRGIGHLYEMEAGDMSGWLYRVNGGLPSYGASGYQLQEGDAIEWIYTCTGDLE